MWVLIVILVLYGSNYFYNQYKPSKITENPKQTDKNANHIAPEIALKDLNGQTVKLSDYKGKVVFLNFWATWCPSCREEMPELNKASQDLAKRKDAVLLEVNLTDGVRETTDKVKEYLNKNKFSMHVLLDTEGKAANDYAITSIPTTFIINRQGQIYDYIVGPTNEDVLLSYVNKIK
jgi:cytochrome c-type biogenesis protein